MPESSASGLTIRDLRYAYDGTSVLEGIHLDVASGASGVLIGPSGSGKSTLLHLIGGLLRVQSGSIEVGGTRLETLSESELDAFRAQHVGVVFQQAHLAHALTVRQNVLLAPFAARKEADPKRADAILARVGLGGLGDRLPHKLSVGQRQRVAIARAVMNSPTLLLADEPTASLDDAHAAATLAVLREEAERVGAILLVATHDARVTQHLPVALRLETLALTT